MITGRRYNSTLTCNELLVEYNRDMKSYSDGEISRSFICNKWSRKLEGTSCRSLKLQLRTFCSINIGIN